MVAFTNRYQSTMKLIRKVYQPSIFGDMQYSVIMKNGDVYRVDENNTISYAGTLEELPNADYGRIRNKTTLPDSVKKAIHDMLNS